MGRKPKQHYPSFFKVLVKDHDFASTLLIPQAFVKRNLEGEVPAKAQIKDQNDSHCWTVEVKKTGEKNHYSFMGSGWRKFVRDCELKDMDFLVFKPITNSVFKIVRYAASGCEKDLISNPVIELPVQDSVSEETRVNPAATARISTKRHVKLRNEKGKVWSVEICLRTYPSAQGRIDLRYGWSDFWKQNKIVDGDSCLFNFIKSARNVIDVVVQKTGRV
ncbi:hypothetical protein RHSIM_Rhsim11G0033700 [Rhododendron simsii]|uniref:TF-B3 domain-containing protein n=1 Tax=Rhododendron simsii TaxID=118357 RepID=A0A834L8Z2_RHOSS|nr:hypothetical protein RHSIM_Rhsim11G0033700 [Rhododendron simsii]